MRKHTPDSASLSLFDGKVCSVCRKWNPFTAYNLSTHGAFGKCPKCKVCCAAYHQRHYKKLPRDQREDHSKRCSRCKEWKPFDTFGEYRRSGRDFRKPYCKECERLVRLSHYRARMQDPLRHDRIKALDRARRANLSADKVEKRREDARLRCRSRRADPKYRATVAAQDHKRRIAQKNGGPSFTAEEFIALCERYGQKCLCCGAKGKLEPDHVIPVVWGGGNGIDNIQPLCKTCNRRKGARHATDYRLLNASSTTARSEEGGKWHE